MAHSSIGPFWKQTVVQPEDTSVQPGINKTTFLIPPFVIRDEEKVAFFWNVASCTKMLFRLQPEKGPRTSQITITFFSTCERIWIGIHNRFNWKLLLTEGASSFEVQLPIDADLSKNPSLITTIKDKEISFPVIPQQRNSFWTIQA
jgi:hypothetical protein